MPNFDTPEPIAATIDIGAGRVVIRASDRADTRVEVVPTNRGEDADVQAAEQVQITCADGRLLVKAPKNKFWSMWGRSPSVDVTIDLPTGSRVDAKTWGEYRCEGRIGDSVFETAAGSIRLDQTGRVRLHTSAGDVSVGRSAGPADVTTSSGKVWLGEVDGTAVVKSSMGDITVGEVTGDARLRTASGDITVERALASLDAKTAYGVVRVGELIRGGAVLETAFGEMSIGIREGTAAWLDVKSNHGSVRSDLEASESPEDTDETVEVRARTGFGDISIRRS